VKEKEQELLKEIGTLQKEVEIEGEGEEVNQEDDEEITEETDETTIHTHFENVATEEDK